VIGGGVLTGPSLRLDGVWRVARYFGMGAFVSAESTSIEGFDPIWREYALWRESWSLGLTPQLLVPLGRNWEPHLFIDAGYALVHEATRNIFNDCSGPQDGLVVRLGSGLGYRVGSNTWLGARALVGHQGAGRSCVLILRPRDGVDLHPPDTMVAGYLALSQRW
jgi:hypothetical protein